MKNLILLTGFLLYFLPSFLSAQNTSYSPIKIEKNKFYHEGNRIKKVSMLKTIVSPLNDTEINALVTSVQNLRTAGIVTILAGDVLLLAGLLKSTKDQKSGKLTLAGAGLLLGGSILSISSSKKMKSVIGLYNERIGAESLSYWQFKFSESGMAVCFHF